MPFETIIPVLIVAYNPDKRLLKSILELEKIDLVKDIIIVDNSDQKSPIIEKCSLLSKVSLLRMEKNVGIAEAQNIGINFIVRKNNLYKWILTLDHDTIISEKLIKKYSKFIETNSCFKVGILSTDYFDIGTGKKVFGNLLPITINEVISSGSLINIDIFIKIGGFKSFYFIDQVDNEYCYRLIRNGYEIIVLPNADMQHQMGHITKKNFFGFKMCLYNQSPLRSYYRSRNLIIFAREYKSYKLWIRNINLLLKDVIRVLFEYQSLKKIKNIYKGVCDGFYFAKYNSKHFNNLNRI